jgi:acetyl-CoA acetyltransferase
MMAWLLRRFDVARADAAIAGVGATEYYLRGGSAPRTALALTVEAILAACQDAGLSPAQIDGFAYYANAGAGYGQSVDTALLIEALGIPEVSFSATLTGGGGGSAGAIGLARAAIVAGEANTVVTVMVIQQSGTRLGQMFADQHVDGLSAFLQPTGLAGPGHLIALLARRHMHKYGTSRDAYAQIALSQRENAMARPGALMRKPMSLDDYFAAPMIADPLCLFDFCLESDGAVAVITTSIERAKDLRQPAIAVIASAQGGSRTWGRGFTWMGMPDDVFASAGHQPVARRLFGLSGLSPADIDVALLYDHFSPMVLMQLEDYGFCDRGEGDAFVRSGAIRFDGGSVPVNTHGGHLSEAYIIGMTHIREAVEQLRGSAINQVAGAELALVTGGPAPLPASALILGRQS